MKSVISALFALVAVSAFAQSGPTFRTATDVRDGVRGSLVGSVTSVMETRNQFVVAPDDDRYGTVTVQGDAAMTTFAGFGGVINGSPEVFQGSQGMSNVRVGDRVEVRGSGAANSVINADHVVLLGRTVQADQVGVGQTRTPSSPSTPTARSTATSDSSTSRIGNVEGIVRDISADDNRFVIQTDRREMITVRGAGSTPVYYRQDVYHIANLEIGDRVRITAESASSTGDIRARAVNVVQSVQEPNKLQRREVGTLTGRVSRIERGTNVIRVQPDTGRKDEVRVDLSDAVDDQGRRVRISDLQAGDQVTLSGTTTNDLFVAATVTIEAAGTNGEVEVTAPPAASRANRLDLGIVTIIGTVTHPLNASAQLVIRDPNDRSVHIYVSEDLIVRTKAGYIAANQLKGGDSVSVKAYRDSDGNLIAQTIRMR
jgi:hypothetical protein